jgi:hypothetical protein
MITNLENKLRKRRGGTLVLHSPAPELGKRVSGERGWTRTLTHALKGRDRSITLLYYQ